MTDKLYLTSSIPPSVNHYMGHRAIIQHGRPICVSYTTKETKQYKENFSEYVREEVKRQGWKPHLSSSKHYYIDTVFYFDRIDRDPNNYYKLLLDAITDSGAAWKDDNVTCERVQGIFYDPENPRIEMVIHPVDYIGVFENASQFASFESNCIGCKRYKRNCSLLRNAQKGLIQKEIDGRTCSSYSAIKKELKEKNDKI